MRRDTAEKCTSTQDVNVFGVTVGDRQYLQISLAEVKARSIFNALYANFRDVASARREWRCAGNG
jgi:hypothetical protein